MGRRNCTKSLKAHTKALVRIGIFQIRLANERKRVWIMRLFDTLSPTRRLYFTAISRELPKCPRLGSQHNQFLHDISHRLIPLRRRPVHLWTFILKVQPLPFRFSKERKDDFHDVDDSASEEEYYENDHDEESDEDTSYDATRNKNVQYHLCLRPWESCRILHLVDAYPTDPHFPRFVKCTRFRLQSLSVLPLLSAHPQQLREWKLEFGQLCCKNNWKPYFWFYSLWFYSHERAARVALDQIKYVLRVY